MANQGGAMKVGIIGAGNMGEAFIAALIRAGVPASSITAVVRRPERGVELLQKYSINIAEFGETVSTSDVLILGVKPQGLSEILPEIAKDLPTHTLVVSLLAGKTIVSLAAGLGADTPIARIMPNTPTLIGKGMAGYSLSQSVNTTQKEFLIALLAATGKAIEIPEELQNALTGTSGSGPAYFFRFVEAMVAGAEKLGLSHEDATTLTIQTIVGAAALLETSGQSPTQLREGVTSMKGATAEAIAVFDEANFDEIVARAMAASARRAGELAQ